MFFTVVIPIVLHSLILIKLVFNDFFCELKIINPQHEINT